MGEKGEAGRGGRSDEAFSRRFLDALIAGIEGAQERLPEITGAGEAVAERLVAGGDLFIASVRPDFVSEGIVRSGGLMMLRAYGPDTALSQRDTAIGVHSRKEGAVLCCQGDWIGGLNRRRAQQFPDESFPASGQQLTADEQHPLRVVRRPEDTWAFHAQVDDAPDGAFDSTASDGQTGLSELRIAHPVGMLLKEVDLLANLRGSSAPTERFQGAKYSLEPTFFEAFTLGVEPVGALWVSQLSTGVDGAGEMLCGVSPIEDFDDPRRVQPQRLNQSSHPVPVFGGSICDKDKQVCL